MANPASGFVVDSLLSPGCVFAVGQSRYDSDHVITSIAFARRLFHQQGRLSSLQLKLKDSRQLQTVKERVRQRSEGRFRALDRYEQQEDTFRIMQIEKFIAYIFLTFILLVACFNIVGSLSMLIIEKKDDVQTLRTMGATDRQVSQVFMFEGRMIAVIGAALGLLTGLLLLWLQSAYGLVRLGGSSGSFVVDAYPVSVRLADVFLVFFTVVAVGWMSVWLPVRYLSRRLL